jgi:hypothetical protein
MQDRAFPQMRRQSSRPGAPRGRRGSR